MQWRPQSHNSVERADAVTSKPVSMNFEIRQDKIRHTNCFILEQNWNCARIPGSAFLCFNAHLNSTIIQASLSTLYLNQLRTGPRTHKRTDVATEAGSIRWCLNWIITNTTELIPSSLSSQLPCWLLNPMACNPHCSVVIQDAFMSWLMI